MKKLIALFFAAGLLSACSSQKDIGSSNNYDDVYYSSNDAQADANVRTNQNQNQNQGQLNTQPASDPNRFDYDNVTGTPASTEQTTDGSGNTYITNNYYDSDDYYDYAYTSRIKRFYTNVNLGFGYYNPYFTNSYWYNYNPSSWGMSIYMGYNWWAPSYYYYAPFTSGWSISFNYGYPSYGYNPYYYPYYPSPYYYSPCYNPYYSPYSYGYSQGYWDGYYNGLYGGYYNPYYYNSYEQYGNYYYGWHGKTQGGHYLSHNIDQVSNITGGFKPIGNLYASNADEGVKSNTGGIKSGSTTTNSGPVKGSVITGGVKPSTGTSGNQTDKSSAGTGGTKHSSHSNIDNYSVKNQSGSQTTVPVKSNNTGGTKSSVYSEAPVKASNSTQSVFDGIGTNPKSVKNETNTSGTSTYTSKSPYISNQGTGSQGNVYKSEPRQVKGGIANPGSGYSQPYNSSGGNYYNNNGAGNNNKNNKYNSGNNYNSKSYNSEPKKNSKQPEKSSGTKNAVKESPKNSNTGSPKYETPKAPSPQSTPAPKGGSDKKGGRQ